jgi:hypothetical protein
MASSAAARAPVRVSDFCKVQLIRGDKPQLVVIDFTLRPTTPVGTRLLHRSLTLLCDTCGGIHRHLIHVAVTHPAITIPWRRSQRPT